MERTKYASRNSGLKPDRGYVGHKAAKLMRRSKAVEERRQAAVAEKAALLRDAEEVEGLKLNPLTPPQRRVLEVRDLSIDYGAGPVCAGLTFTVERGDRVLLRGANGAGKSSLLKLLLGREIPHTGRLWRSGGLTVSELPQDTGFLRGELETLIRESGVEEALFKAILRKLGFPRSQFAQPLEAYSAGQKKKVLLARSLCEAAHLYIWDEPLNYVDIYTRMQLEELLLTHRPTMVFVEHDQAFTDKVATKVIEL